MHLIHFWSFLTISTIVPWGLEICNVVNSSQDLGSPRHHRVIAFSDALNYWHNFTDKTFVLILHFFISDHLRILSPSQNWLQGDLPYDLAIEPVLSYRVALFNPQVILRHIKQMFWIHTQLTGSHVGYLSVKFLALHCLWTLPASARSCINHTQACYGIWTLCLLFSYFPHWC